MIGMTREQTWQLKGIAISFMIWGHLFGSPDHVLSAYHPLLLIGDMPLVTTMSRAMGPVAFFLLLSGYGLFCANQHGDKHRYSRIVKLLLTYWIVLIITMMVGRIVGSDRYPLSLNEVVLNFTGLYPTYIPEAWFLPPYILLALTAPWEFRFLRKVRARYILPIAFILNLGTSFLLSCYGSTHIYSHRVFYMLFCWFHFQFSFLMGMVMARNRMLTCFLAEANLVKCHIFSKRFFSIALIMLFLGRCLVNSSAVHSIYVCAFVLIWTRIVVPVRICKSLVELGKRSTGMWFVHTTLGLYLFADWFNWLQNPFLVYLSVTFASWIVSIIVGFICTKLINATNLIYHRNS